MENRRAGEKKGRKLSPGERAKNWASAAVTLWPILVFLLGLLGYTNADKIPGFAETEIVNNNLENEFTQFSRETVARLNRLEKQIKNIQTGSKTGDSSLRDELEQLRAEVRAWHE